MAAAAAAAKKRKVCHNAVMEDTQLQTLSIPNDITVEILSRLPAKSLLPFRWVCKYWFDLLTRDRNFVKLHVHHRSTSNIDPCDDQIIMTINRAVWMTQCASGNLLQYYYIDSTTGLSSDRVTINVNPIIFGKHDGLNYFEILGSCHGLLLLSYLAISFPHPPKKEIYCIWNPCTKEYKKLPDPYPYYSLNYTTSFGFGYDRSIDDYKVVRNVGSYNGKQICQVYTLGTNSWRNIVSIPGNLVPDSSWGDAVFVNGALYWKDYSNKRIISFDIEKERYEEISNQPPECCFPDYSNSSVKLEIFEGSLCLMLYYKDIIEMWVMKKESSWTKLFKIRGDYHNILRPLRFTKNGEILLLDSGKGLFFCDPKDNTTRNFNRTGEVENRSFGLEDHGEAVYIESLVFFNSGTYTFEEEPN